MESVGAGVHISSTSLWDAESDGMGILLEATQHAHAYLACGQGLSLCLLHVAFSLYFIGSAVFRFENKTMVVFVYAFGLAV